MNRALLAAPLLLLALGCGADNGGDPAPSPTADLKKVSERWAEMTEQEQSAVCAAASAPLPGEGEIGGTSTSTPDYREMLNAIEKAGYSQPEATAMIPYALNECR